jgi:hypothetical protein
MKSSSDSPPVTAQKTKQSQTTTTLPKKKSKKKHAKNLNANVKTELYRVGALSRVLNAMKKWSVLFLVGIFAFVDNTLLDENHEGYKSCILLNHHSNMERKLSWKKLWFYN